MTAPPYPTRRDTGPVVLNSSEIGMGGPTTEEMVLANGAFMQEIAGGWDVSADKRYMAAITDARHRASFVVYDTVEHVRYHYKDDGNAEGLFRKLFARVIGDRTPKPTVLDTVLSQSTRVQLQPFRGLWLPPYEYEQCPEEVITETPRPGLTLSAVLDAPADLRTLENPLAPIQSRRWRVAINDEASSLQCINVGVVVGSEDGCSLVFEEILMYYDEDTMDRRWHVWRKGQDWLSLDGIFADDKGREIGRLICPHSITAEAISFAATLTRRGAPHAWARAAGMAMPLPVTLTKQGESSTAEVSLPG